MPPAPMAERIACGPSFRSGREALFGRYEALEFLVPVLHGDERGRRIAGVGLARFDHQEALAVQRHVVGAASCAEAAVIHKEPAWDGSATRGSSSARRSTSNTTQPNAQMSVRLSTGRPRPRITPAYVALPDIKGRVLGYLAEPNDHQRHVIVLGRIFNISIHGRHDATN
jgi:hypothetical protein